MSLFLSLAQPPTPPPANPAQAFLLTNPRYAVCGQAVEVSDYAITLLSYTDGFELALRRYLAGQPNTLGPLHRAVRHFLRFDERGAKAMIDFSLNAVQDKVLELEGYELMTRFQTVRNHLHRSCQL